MNMAEKVATAEVIKAKDDEVRFLHVELAKERVARLRAEEKAKAAIGQLALMRLDRDFSVG